jgi:protein-S-isoprenylcysteine O-methyltransferase Ste14
VIYYGLVVIGALLCAWARWALPPDTIDFPVPVVTRTHRGPYRWLAHPMYAGTVLLVTGMGGLGGGAWTALAVFTLSELLTREWAWRESSQPYATLCRMTDQERALMRKLYELQIELFNHQGDEIEALRKANDALRKSHEIIGQMLKLTADAMGLH